MSRLGSHLCPNGHPARAGNVSEVGRLEVPGGDLHQNGRLGGKLLDADQARAAVAAA
jgi:hypothetical protein